MDELFMQVGAAMAVPAVLFFIKVYILFRAARRKTIRRWFYFTQQEVIEAPTPHAARLRKAQNALSVAFFILSGVGLLLLFLFHK